MTVLERMTEILSVVRDTWSLLFSSLFGAQRVPADVVVTLLAVLELVRLGNIRVQQTELFGDIVIERRPARSGYRSARSTLPTPIDVVEALLFASDIPLEAERIREVLDLADPAEAGVLVEELRARYAAADRALAIVEVGGGYRMVTRPEIAPWLVRLARSRTRAAAQPPGAGDAGHRGLSAAGVAPRGRCRPRREFRRRAGEPARAAAHPHRGPQGRARPPVPLRDDARVPRGLRPAGPRPICPRSRASCSSPSWREPPSMASLRLNKILAQAGLASRRAADRLIVEGRVAVNGVVDPRGRARWPIPSATDRRRRPCRSRHAEGKHYVLLNKPRGYLTSRADPAGPSGRHRSRARLRAPVPGRAARRRRRGRAAPDQRRRPDPPAAASPLRPAAPLRGRRARAPWAAPISAAGDGA